MSIRRINSTGRRKILREDALIFVRPDSDGMLSFDAKLDLTGYDLPDDARVFVEAYRQTSFMRFPHGTVADPQSPPELARRLTEFASREGLRFRVKVTSTGERAGVLLAEGDRIPVNDDEEQPDDRIALLPTAPEDLGQETWRVDLTGANGPLLLVNKRVANWPAVAASPLFRSLVYPAAMQQVLWHIYKVEETLDMDDTEDWRCRWLRFAAELPCVGDPPTDGDDDHWGEWITTAVESFSRENQMLEHYIAFLAVEASA